MDVKIFMTENKKFWITTSIAITALLISITSTIFNEIRYAKNEQESVYVNFRRLFADYPVTIIDNYSGINRSGLINVTWEVIISNTGKYTTSITEYNLWAFHQDGLIQYSYLNQGLFGVDHKRVNLPINIEPGSSIKLFLKTGLSLGPKASKFISAAPPSVKRTIMTLSNYLAGKGMVDFFDNPVTPFWNHQKTQVIGFRVDSDKNDQILVISFKTAKNNIFTDESRWYEFQR